MSRIEFDIKISKLADKLYDRSLDPSEKKDLDTELLNLFEQFLNTISKE